jgi:hypothetical protein
MLIYFLFFADDLARFLLRSVTVSTLAATCSTTPVNNVSQPLTG